MLREFQYTDYFSAILNAISKFYKDTVIPNNRHKYVVFIWNPKNIHYTNNNISLLCTPVCNYMYDWVSSSIHWSDTG